MKLVLDYTQRLNLHAVLGLQRGNANDIRAIWKFQDRIDLTAAEKEKINYRVIEVNGMNQVNWDVRDTTPKEYEVNTEEFNRVAAALKEFNGMSANDRRWLEPLLAQIDMVEKANAARDKKKQQSDAAD